MQFIFLKIQQTLELLLGKFEGDNMKHLHKLSRLALDCVLSEINNVDNFMKSPYKSDNEKKNLYLKLHFSAAKKFKETFSEPDFNLKAKNVINDCSEAFARIFYIDLYIKLLGLLELDEYGWNPVKYLTGSFISVLDGIHQDLNAEKQRHHDSEPENNRKKLWIVFY